MAQATVQDIPFVAKVARDANCNVCLTRNCPMAGSADYPVQVCNTYRQANCYFCSQVDCSMNGQQDSPVMLCDRFQLLAVA